MPMNYINMTAGAPSSVPQKQQATMITIEPHYSQEMISAMIKQN